MASLLRPLRKIDHPASRTKGRRRDLRRQTAQGDGLAVAVLGKGGGVSYEQPCRADAALRRLLAQEKLWQHHRKGAPLGGTDSHPAADMPPSFQKNLRP